MGEVASGTATFGSRKLRYQVHVPDRSWIGPLIECCGGRWRRGAVHLSPWLEVAGNRVWHWSIPLFPTRVMLCFGPDKPATQAGKDLLWPPLDHATPPIQPVRVTESRRWSSSDDLFHSQGFISPSSLQGENTIPSFCFSGRMTVERTICFYYLL